MRHADVISGRDDQHRAAGLVELRWLVLAIYAVPAAFARSLTSTLLAAS